MAKRSLRPQLNQIRAWVRQGRTDAWIAHQLEISAAELREFRRQHGLSPDEEDSAAEIDLRDEIEAEVEAATAEQEAEEAERERERAEAEKEKAEGKRAKKAGGETELGEEEAGSERAESGEEEAGSEEAAEETGERPRRRRRRGRRGGRGRRRAEIEATFDHGEKEGFGLWLDPAVQDDATYKESWAGHREVTVTIEPDQIVIRRAGSEDGE
ncbi:MAG: hypothetical protein U0R52_06255 [Solirubrobacterales bacterium]